MIYILDSKPTEKQIEEMLEDYPNYIKIVVDFERRILAGGGEYHVDGEELLLRSGSKQSDLWGGGIDMNTKEISYSALTNMKPRFENLSSEISDPKIREKFDKIVKEIFELE